MTFNEAVAADTLGTLLPEQLPEIATNALSSGIDGSLLAALAGESPRSASPDELHSLFNRALAELGVERPSLTRAAEIMRDYYARRVVEGDLSPRVGAEAIVRGVLDRLEGIPRRDFVGQELGVARLVGLFYDYEVAAEGYATAAEVDAEVLEECRRILGAPAA